MVTCSIYSCYFCLRFRKASVFFMFWLLWDLFWLLAINKCYFTIVVIIRDRKREWEKEREESHERKRESHKRKSWETERVMEGMIRDRKRKTWEKVMKDRKSLDRESHERESHERERESHEREIRESWGIKKVTRGGRERESHGSLRWINSWGIVVENLQWVIFWRGAKG